ncbi:CvpA family protein [Thermodesulfobacteriota bacterium]
MSLADGYNFVDLIIIGTLVVTLILGIWKGFVRSLTALAALVFGVILAVRYYPTVEPYLGKITTLDKQISMILSMVLIFIVVQIVFVLIRKGLDTLMDVTHLNWIDRILGAVMGIAGGFMVVSLMVQGLLLGVPDWPPVKKSRFAKPVDQLSKKIMDNAPKSVKDRIQEFVKKWKGEETTKKTPPRKPPTSPSARPPQKPLKEPTGTAPTGNPYQNAPKKDAR